MDEKNENQPLYTIIEELSSEDEHPIPTLPAQEKWPVSFDEYLFASLYPYFDNDTLGKVFNLSRAAIACRASRRGIAKNPEVVREAKSKRYNNPSRSSNHRAWGNLSPEEITQKRREVMTGPKSPRWKGGVRRTGRIRDIKAWRWRAQVIKRDGYRCIVCGKSALETGKPLHADHIDPWATHPERRYDPTNGQTLCYHHHRQRHFGEHRIEPERQEFDTPPAGPELITCACGCGTMIERYHPIWGGERSFANGHNRRNVPHTKEVREQISSGMKYYRSSKKKK